MAAFKDSVGGRVGYHKGSQVSRCCSALACRSVMSIFPRFIAVDDHHLQCRPWQRWQDWCRVRKQGSAPHCGTTRSLLSWYLRITSSPAYSPAAPELGWKETSSKPVIAFRKIPTVHGTAGGILRPGRGARRDEGCRIRASSWASISMAAFSFMVHDPRGSCRGSVKSLSFPAS